jgi:hypothetical protein
MASTRTKITIGTLMFILLSSGAIYVNLETDDACLSVRLYEDYTGFLTKVNCEGRYLTAGNEEFRLMDGSKVVPRDKANIEIHHFLNETPIRLVLEVPYKNDQKSVINHTYTYNPNSTNITQFPVAHAAELFNAEGLFYRYTVDDLKTDGNKIKYTDGETVWNFGLNMRVEVDPGYRWAWQGLYYGTDSLTVQYGVDSDYEVINTRLFDPPTNVGNCTELMDINSSLNADYVLTNDIDCAGVSVTPLGNSTIPFGGSIDGAGYTISNMDYGTTNKGFFGGYNVTAYDQVHNITFDNMTLVSSASGTSTLINEPITDFYINDINIINSQITGSQTNTGLLLGIAQNQDTATVYGANIRNIFVNNSNIVALNAGGVTIGKLQAGTNTVSNIQVINSNVSGNVAVGGIIGDITTSANTTITNVSFDGRVIAASHSFSGILGRWQDTAGYTLIIRNAYAGGYLEGIQRGGGIFGFAQNSAGTIDIDDVYSTATINTTGTTNSGGIAGYPKGTTITIDNAFALNGETESITNAGGIIGEVTATNTITNSYWQNTTTTAVSCVSSTSNNTGCTVENSFEYYTNVSQAPMSSWDISTAYTKDSRWVDQNYLNETPCLAFEDSCLAEPSCSYTSGDFTIACGTCNVTDNEALGSNDMIFTGTGEVLISSNVSGVVNTNVDSCNVRLTGSITG